MSAIFRLLAFTMAFVAWFWEDLNIPIDIEKNLLYLTVLWFIVIAIDIDKSKLEKRVKSLENTIDILRSRYHVQ
jgi:hypothetical protein